MAVSARDFSARRMLFLATLMPVLLVGLTRATLAAPQTLTVVVDQAMMVRLPERVATIVIGNPLIADIAVQPGGIAVVTGKGYGATNLIALDRAGATLLERNIIVQGPRDKVVVVYKGVERETYSCTPKCERRITLGDSPPYFDATLTQAGSRTGQAQGTPGLAK